MGGVFNPNDPFTIGLEWEATSQTTVPIDFGQELGMRIIPATSTILRYVDFYADFPDVQAEPFANRVLASVYAEGADQVPQQVFTERLAADGGAMAGDAAFYGGAAAIADALATPRDGRGINLAALTGSWVRPTFALPSFPNVVNPRILDVTVELRVSGADPTDTGLVGVAWYFEGTGTWWSFASLKNMTVDANNDLQVLCRLGETRFTSNAHNTLAPWLPSDFADLNSGAAKLYVANFFATTFSVEYVGVVVTYCEENRLAVGAAPFKSPQLPGWKRVPDLYDLASGTPIGVALGQGIPYLLTLTRATDSDSDYTVRSANNPEFSQSGPGVPLAAIRPMTGAGFDTVTIPRYSDGRIAGPAVASDTGFAIDSRDGALTTPIAGASQPYFDIYPSTASLTTQTISTLQPGLYTHLSALVKPQGSPGVLTFTVGSATATLTVDEFADYEPGPDGYAIVTVPLSIPVTVTPGASALVTATTMTGVNRWLIPTLSTGPSPGWLSETATYGGTTFDANSTDYWDAPITLHMAVPAVTGVVVTGGYFDLSPVDPTCRSSLFSTVDYVRLSWGDVPVYANSLDAGATPTFVNVGTQMAVAAATGSPGMPASLATGDFLILSIETNQTHTPAFVTESGGTWTFLHDQQASTFTRLTQYTSIYNGTQTAPIIAATADHAIARIAAYRGVNQSAPIDASDIDAITITGSPGPGTFPTVTTTGPNRLIVYTVGDGVDSAAAFVANHANLLLTSIAERYDSGGTTGSGGEIASWDGGLAAAGGSGTATATLTGAQLNFAVSTIALAPALLTAPAVTGSPLVTGFCAWEVERRDAVDSTWRPIARVTNRDARAISDMEARIGIRSDYRVRACRVDGVCGAWTAVTGHTRLGPSATGPPIITGGCDGLIFTSNEDPSATLAYPYSFEGTVAEDFTFVEAETVSVQRLHMRDYQVALRPLERGGVRFQRTLVVNATSVPPERLDRGFLDLRDLAWATLSYVAVLDTRGNRWFASVIVPAGIVREPIQTYIASVDIIEVTDRPSVIDVRAL